MAFAGVALVATDAPAETAPAAAQQSASAPEIAATEWVKLCDANNAAACQVTADYALAGSASPIASVSVQTSADPDKFAIGIQVPLGFMLQAGIPLSVDGAKKATAQFVTCLPSPQGPAYFCLARAVADGGFVDTLRKGKTLELKLVAADRKTTTLALPLTTFAQALDGPDQASLARQREDNAKLVEEKAKALAKKLEGQPPKP